MWNYARETPFWWDKIRVWFMPAGWRPRGIPEKELVEITTENQVRFRPPMFANAQTLSYFASRFRNRSDDGRYLKSLRLEHLRQNGLEHFFCGGKS